MLQSQVPVFPTKPTQITTLLDFAKEGDSIVYFFHGMPVFSHEVGNVTAFRMITAQFCVNGHATEAEIVRVFGVAASSVSQAVELYRAKGPAGFYDEPEHELKPTGRRKNMPAASR